MNWSVWQVAHLSIYVYYCAGRGWTSGGEGVPSMPHAHPHQALWGVCRPGWHPGGQPPPPRRPRDRAIRWQMQPVAVSRHGGGGRGVSLLSALGSFRPCGCRGLLVLGTLITTTARRSTQGRAVLRPLHLRPLRPLQMPPVSVYTLPISHGRCLQLPRPCATEQSSRHPFHRPSRRGSTLRPSLHSPLAQHGRSTLPSPTCFTLKTTRPAVILDLNGSSSPRLTPHRVRPPRTTLPCYHDYDYDHDHDHIPHTTDSGPSTSRASVFHSYFISLTL